MKLKSNLRLLDIVLYASILYFILFLFFRLLLVYSFAADIGGIENNVIYSVCKVMAGGALYDNPESGNFNITQYTPIFYYMVIFCSKLFGLNPINDLHSIYIIARVISLMANLLGFYFIFKLLTQCFHVNKKIAFIAGVCFFIHLTRIQFSARPDAMFGLVFILIIYCFVIHFQQKENKKRYLILGLLLAAISVFIKQSGIQFFIIIPTFFFLLKEYKNGITSILLLIILTTVFAFLCYNTFSQNFITNAVNGLNNGFVIAHIYNIFSFFLMKYQLIFILGICFSLIFIKSTQLTELRFLSFTLVGVFIFAFVTSIKLGAWINYYNEFITTSILLTAIKFESLSQKIKQDDPIHRFTGIFCAVLIVFLLPNMMVEKLFYEHYQHIPIKESRNLYQKKQVIALTLQAKLLKNEYFLCFDEHINAMLPLKSVIPNKDLVPAQSKFNYQNFISEFKAGQITYVVYPTNRPLVSFMDCSFLNFKEVYTDKDFTILKQ
jgi:hypothetical protein